MSGAPDPKPVRERKGNRPIRVKDPGAVKIATLLDRECAACGEDGANGHHVVQKGAPHFGDDVRENVLTLCGSGTMRCHGAFHGNPYSVEVPSPFPFEEGTMATAHRDQRWVAQRMGHTMVTRRQDVIAYVVLKLGDEAGREYLSRTYWIEERNGEWQTM